jgi:hypothetical protein
MTNAKVEKTRDEVSSTTKEVGRIIWAILAVHKLTISGQAVGAGKGTGRGEGEGGTRGKRSGRYEG